MDVDASLPTWPVDWPAPARVRACMTLRSGGSSAPPFDSLNLGLHVGDDPRQVQANRDRLCRQLGVQTVFMTQVHGVGVVDLAQVLDVQADDVSRRDVQADACLSARAGLACTVMVADCLPVLMADRQARWVAAAHAGWRGLAGTAGHGVLEAVVQALGQRGVPPQDLMAWLGPCIGPQQFEVGEEVRQALCQGRPAAAQHFRAAARPGYWLADLPALARQQLLGQGLGAVYGNDGSLPWCTVSQASRFFSHRRDSRLLGSTGRMAALVWLER